MKEASVNLNLSQQNSILPTKKYERPGKLAFDIQAGKVIKEIVIKVHGKITPTFTGTAPTLHKYGIADALIRSLEVNDGHAVRKSFVGVDVLRRETRMLTGESAPVIYKMNSSEFGSSPSIGYIPDLGTSGQSITFAECFSIVFENKHSSEWARTLFNTVNKLNAKLDFQLNDIKSIIDKGDTSGASDISIEHDISFDVELIESPALINMPITESWRQNQSVINIHGQQNQQRHDLPKGNKVQGFWITAYMGSKKRRVTIDEAKKIMLAVRLNDKNQTKEFSLFDLQYQNLTKTMLQKFQDGSGYCNFLNNSTFDSALPTSREAGIQNYQLIVTTPKEFDYSKPLELIIEQNEIELL